MTDTQLRLLLLTSEIVLVNAAIVRLDRHGFSTTRPELVPQLAPGKALARARTWGFGRGGER